MVEKDLFQDSGSFDRLGDVVAPSDLFDREFGAQFAGWELKLHSQFQEKIGSRRYLFRGFTHYTRDKSMVLLTPSPWLHNGIFLFFPMDSNLPKDGSRIEATAKRVVNPRVLEKSGKMTSMYSVESWSDQPLDILSSIDPPLSLKELSSLLFEHVGMAEASKRVFARLFVSSPPFEGGVGGMTAGIQAIASKAQVKRLLSFMKGILPPTMQGKIGRYRKVESIPVMTRRTWRMNVSKISIPDMRTICVERIDPSGFSEVSLGSLTDSETATLPDVPLALATEDFWIETTNARDLRLPILKSVITSQMLSPAVSSKTVDAGTRHILSRLEIVRDSFGLDDSSLSRGSILDADTLGRPLSALRLARSSARAAWKEKITAKDLKSSWDRILEPALKEFIELTEFKVETRKEYGDSAQIHKFNTKVWRALRKLDTGKSGDLGPTIEQIASEAGVEIHTAAQTLSQMKDAGVVYEPRPGHYRLV